MKAIRGILRHLALFTLAVPLLAFAAYPEKPIRLVVPFPAGGGTDATARLIATALAERLKQSVVVDNRPGAAGSIAAQAVIESPADGYTLFFATTGTLAINPHLYAKLSYDPLTQFSPIATVASSANVLVVHPSVPAKSVGELIALAKSKPGALTYGSSGNGSSSHLAGVLFESLTGTKLLHVPYKGSAPALVDFLAGRVDMMIDNYPTYTAHVKSGAVRPLGVSGKTTSPLFPGVPTISAAGVPGYDVTIWYAILGPAGMPADIVNRISNELRQIVGTPAIKQALEAIGSESMIQSPAEFAAFIRTENRKWADIVRKSGAKLD